MSEYLVKAIKSLKPGAEFSIVDNDYSTITWDVLEGKAPTQAQIDSEIEKIQAAELAAEAEKAAAKSALLERLGITEEEAKLLLA
jgi:hypothetical protein